MDKERIFSKIAELRRYLNKLREIVPETLKNMNIQN